MKKAFLFLGLAFALMSADCEGNQQNTSAASEQAHIEGNQQDLNRAQPSPTITWSMERDNLIKRFKLMNDRSVVFYMYVFIEGQSQPVGYYTVNKVSSVNSQLTAMQQIVKDPNAYGAGSGGQVIESPAEDGSYGSNGDGVFGFTPEDIYIEHNMKYIVSTVPLHFQQPVNKLAVVSLETEKQLKEMMAKLKQQ